MKVKSRLEILKILIEDGYTPDRHWRFTKPDKVSFDSTMFEYCGKYPSGLYHWKVEWLEQNEDTPKEGSEVSGYKVNDVKSLRESVSPAGKASEKHINSKIKALLIDHNKETGIAITSVYMKWFETMGGGFMADRISVDSQSF